MLNKLDMLEHIDNIRKSEAQLTGRVKTFVQNKDIPLEDRWEVFIEARCGHEEPFIQHFKSINDDILNAYEYIMYFERREVLAMDDVWERMMDSKEEILERHPDTDFDAFREEVLDKFLWSYVMDW
jgi:hypothetical protein